MGFWLLVGAGGVICIIILAFKAMKDSSRVDPNKGPKIRGSDGEAIKKGSQKVRSTDGEASKSPRGRVAAHCDGDADGFATFTISYGGEEGKSKNKAVGRWIPAGESVTVKGHVITKGHIYCGGALASLDGYGTEASLIDDSLKVVNQPSNYEDESLGYWPKYISISSGCRGALLGWLASDRDDPSALLGYVFIYFYGLERRVVVDSIQGEVDDLEYKSIFEEVLRLRKVYSHSRSFLNYAIRLLEIMCLLRPNVVAHPELEKSPKQGSILIKYKLAKTVDEGKPIPVDMALAWLKLIPDYSLRKPARRCAYEFSQMFSQIYLKEYGEGIIVKPNKTRLKIEYWPASSSLGGVKIPQEDLPDPSNLKGPTRKLTSLADKCIDSLEAYSRYLGKSDTSRTDIAAVLLLPDELSDLGAKLGLSKFKKWAEERLSSQSVLVDVSEFWQFTKTPLPVKMNKKESSLIYMLAEKAGVGIAPDIRYHHTKPVLGGKLVLFRDGHGKFFEPSRAFNELGMALRLGAMVATIDSHLDEAESLFLKQLIDHDTNISPIEKNSLHAYLVWRLNTPSNITGLKSRLEKLGRNEKAAVSNILVGVALADGKIDPSEVKQLEKLYTLLGLEKSLVTGDIHNLTTNKKVEFKVKSSSGGLGVDSEKPKEFLLDESVLALHESQTKDVQTMLGAIFLDETDIEETPVTEEYIVEEEDAGIDSQHYALYEGLINKDRWSRDEMNDLCKNLGLMTSGAIETINDWAFEKVDAPVLEEETDAVYVDQEIVEELEG